MLNLLIFTSANGVANDIGFVAVRLHNESIEDSLSLFQVDFLFDDGKLEVILVKAWPCHWKILISTLRRFDVDIYLNLQSCWVDFVYFAKG